MLSNRTFDDIKPGDTAEIRRLVTIDDLIAFANVSGNHNPMHLHDLDGDGDGTPEAVAPGLFTGALISAVLGNVMPGAGTLYRSQSLEFVQRAHAGDEVTAQVTVISKNDQDGTVTLETQVRRCADNAVLVTGHAVVEAPRHRIEIDDHALPGLIVQRHRHFEALLAQAQPLRPLKTAVVCPDEPNALGGALLGRRHGLIEPVLVGDAAKISETAKKMGADIAGVEVVHEPDDQTAAARAVALINDDKAEALMKGHLHTDELLKPVLQRDTGLRGRRRLSHVFVMDVPGLDHPLLVTDAAINIAPDLRTKADIVQNAIDLGRSIGLHTPKVGILSAVETVNPDIPSSIDGALLSKMAQRGQIKGGVVDGPLAMDNAVNMAAARTKGISSPVAGQAEILVVPNIDAGNMLAKQLAYISHAEGAGLVMGARVPIILNSRADDEMARLASCAVAALHHARISGA